MWRSLAQSYSLDPARTVITGYSMGGWASYKLAFEHPDDFAGALVLDGPVVCGIEFYPGENGQRLQRSGLLAGRPEQAVHRTTRGGSRT